jgi:hypothetical protein
MRDDDGGSRSEVNYQFLLGRTFSADEQTYLVSALGAADGQPIVRASARIDGEQVMRVFPADYVMRHLVIDEEIILREVSFA